MKLLTTIGLILFCSFCLISCQTDESNVQEESSQSAVQAVHSPAISSSEIITTLPEGKEIPEGMVFVPGGRMMKGSKRGLPREQPVTEEYIQAFYMDKHPVTVAQWRAFVNATGFQSQAEIFGDAAVFNMENGQWYLQNGAYWEYPQGQEAGKAPDDHPVTQISWNDVQAYCKWAGKRLPTEAEWEHAARNGNNSRSIYSWGEEIRRGDVYLANTWQGHFPYMNTNEDGYLFTSPVGKFNENDLGLQDMSGNVWEWCEDWYMTYGPNSQPLFDNQGSGEKEKVMRGGSFLCDPNYCHGYRVSGRSGSTPETGLFHVGFRCVKDITL